VVDEAHLQRMAASGRVRVALDVFAMEPLKPGSPWLDIPAACIPRTLAGQPRMRALYAGSTDYKTYAVICVAKR